MDGKIEITQNMRVADARANITELISRVRLLRWIVVLQNRRTPMAALVPIELGEAAKKVGGADRAVEILSKHFPAETPGEED
jgi:hypothetical protein